MESPDEAPRVVAAPAPRDDEPEPQPRRPAEPIDEHHFQRPIVSPVPSGVRTEPRGG